MTGEAQQIPLLLFAKAPQPGKVKTRLQPQCTERQCAEIAEILLRETVAKVTAHWPGRVILSAWPNTTHKVLADIANSYPLELALQASGDLGEKMHLGLSKYGYPAAVVGCDAPQITGDTLRQAHQSLRRGRNVIGPSEDGGYYLIGLSAAAPVLFEEIQWGSATVYQRTLDKAAQRSLEFELLPVLNDIDTWPDVVSAASEVPRLQDYLQRLSRR